MTLPPAAHDPLRRLLAREVRQRAGEHERLARPAGPRRAAGPPPRSAGRRAGRRSAAAAPSSWAWISSATIGPMPGRLGDLLRRRGEQRVDGAEVLREAAAGDVADALDPDREQHDAERPLAAGLDRAPAGGPRSPRRNPSSSSSRSGVEPVEVGDGAHQARAAGRSRPASPPARRCPSRARTSVSSCQRRSGQSRFGQRVKTPRLDRRRVAERAALRRPRRRRAVRRARRRAARARRPAGSRRRRAGRSRRRPGRTSLRARSSSLCSVAALTVTPPTWTGSSAANGCRSPNLPTFQLIAFSRVTAVVGGNFQAIAQRGSRPTTPSRRCSSKSSTFTTTPSISKSSAPRRCCQCRHWATTSSSVASFLTSPLTRKPCSRSHSSASQCELKLEPLGDADRVAPHRQRPLGGERRVELADRPRGAVARVHERREPGLGAPLVERGEVRQRHVDLAADLEQRRRVVDPQRDRADRAQVVGDVLADLAVAARGAAHEHAVAVEQRDREPVDLRLGHELERRLLDPLAREVVAHPVHPGAQLLLGARVGEREHRLQVRDLLELAHRLPADALGRRVGRQQLRVLALDRAQLVQQRVVGVVADLRVVEDVVAVAVVGELLAQLGGRAQSVLHPRRRRAAGRGRTRAAPPSRARRSGRSAAA